jgi:hypothetical protein
MEIIRAITVAERNHISIKQLDKEGFYLLCHKSGNFFLNELLLFKLLINNCTEDIITKMSCCIAEDDFSDLMYIINNDVFFSKLRVKVLNTYCFL